MKISFFPLLLAVLLSSCTSLVSSKVPQSAMKLVKIGMQEDDVEEKIGPPTSTEFLNDRVVWHYKVWEDDGKNPEDRSWHSSGKMIWYTVHFDKSVVSRIEEDVENPDGRVNQFSVDKAKNSLRDSLGSPKVNAKFSSGCYSRTRPPKAERGCRLNCVNDTWTTVCK